MHLARVEVWERIDRIRGELPEDIGDRGVPHVALSVQDGIYYKLPFVAPLAMYGALAFVMFRNRRANKDETGEGGGKP